MENDFQVGGKYKARMESVDKKFGFDFVVTYDSIIEYEAIKYTMEDSRTVAVTFENRNNTTYVKTVFDAEGENTEEMQKNGWQAILNNFKKYVETKR